MEALVAVTGCPLDARLVDRLRENRLTLDVTLGAPGHGAYAQLLHGVVARAKVVESADGQIDLELSVDIGCPAQS